MIKNGILSIVFATLLICGAAPHVNAATFTFNSITIDDFDEGGGDNALNIETSAIITTPYTTPNLSVGESLQPFDLFNIWTTESTLNDLDDFEYRPITVYLSFNVESNGTIFTGSGDPITGNTYGDADWEENVPIVGATWVNDEGFVIWDFTSYEFSFGNGGLFTVSLSSESFNKDANYFGLPYSIDFNEGFPGAAVQATIEYIQAPTVVPVPPAIIMLGTGILGIAGIRRKYKK